MAKRYGHRDPMQVYAAVFADAAYAYPELRASFELDQARLRDWFLQRGESVFYTDLPAVAKHLDRCLALGEYSQSGLPLTKGSSELALFPRFLRGLYMLVFEPGGVLKQVPDTQAIYFLRQILCLMKKDKCMCAPEKVEQEVRSFFDVDAALPEPGRFWTLSNPTAADAYEAAVLAHRRDYYLAKVIAMAEEGNTNPLLHDLLFKVDLVFALISSTLGVYNPSEWRFRHGPGAVSAGGRLVDKYRWLSWSSKLENVFPIADYGFHNYGGWAGWAGLGGVVDYEPCSRLVAVPKSFSKPRLIAAEPAEHQWCQQNIWHYLSDRVVGSWIHRFVRFRDQTANQELALRSSLDGRCATVDLEAASDRVTCPMVEVAFRGNLGLLLALQATRTLCIQQQLCRDIDTVVRLKKFSTMGSACTFPVESLVFLGLTIASVLTARRLRVTPENIARLQGEVAVFGDDIVVPVDAREIFERCFEVFDFKINALKTFWTGRFRESCGVDAFAGVNVTPAFWQSPNGGRAESYATAIAVSNNFYSKFLLETAATAESTIAEHHVPLVPMDSGFCALKTFVKPRRVNTKTRWNKDLMEVEYKVPVLTGRSRVTPRTDDSALLQFFTEDPDPALPWTGGLRRDPVLRVRHRWVPSRYLD